MAAHLPSDHFSMVDAADIIKTIDSAFADASTSIVTAAREREEAKNNARAASEVARRFMEFHGLSPKEFEPEKTAPKGSFMNGSSHSTSRRPLQEASRLHNHSSIEPTAKVPNNGGRLAAETNSASEDNRVHLAAEEMISVSLELDRVKHSLELEQMTHDETKSALFQAKAKSALLEAQIDRLLSDMETQREESWRKIDVMEQELTEAKVRVKAAEEDAELALQLAKEDSLSREQVEEVLQNALLEIDHLREQVTKKPLTTTVHNKLHNKPRPPPPPPSSKLRNVAAKSLAEDQKLPSPKTVRFADSPTILAVATDDAVHEAPASPCRPGRTLVVSGRQLLQRSLGSPPRDGDSSFSGRGSESVSERRQRLRDRLRSMDVDIPTPSSSASSVTFSPNRGTSPTLASSNAVDVLLSTANIFKTSGRRLGLTGRWWNESSEQLFGGDLHVETLARHYCTSVEALMDRKQREVVELESLCALWEQGVTPDGNL